MAGNKPDKADETILTLLETATATHYRTDFGNITFDVGDIAVTPLIYRRVSDVQYGASAEHRNHVAEHSAHGTHPSQGSMTDFLPVIDRLNAEICR